jgi:hypothetical protein
MILYKSEDVKRMLNRILRESKKSADRNKTSYCSASYQAGVNDICADIRSIIRSELKSIR